MAPLNVLATDANLDDITIPMITGPMLLGFLLGYCLYGILIVQMYIYHVHFRKDSIYIKVYVWVLFFFESVYAVLCTAAAWRMFASGWGNPTSLLYIDWPWQPMPLMNGFMAAMAQSFYVWRIWKLTKSIWMPAVIECFALLQMISAFYYGVHVDITGRFDKVKEQSTMISVWLSASALCDALITVAFVIALRRAHSNSYFQQTLNIITRLIRYTVETGLLTSTFAIAELVLWLALTKWNFHYTIFITIGRLYSNALMATLNSRALIYADNTDEETSIRFMNSSTRPFWHEMNNQTTTSSSTTRALVKRPAREVNESSEHEMVVVSEQHLKQAKDTSFGDGDETLKYKQSPQI